MMQQLVESQADGWAHATDEVSRFYEQVEASTPPRGAAAGLVHRCDRRAASGRRST